MNRPLDRNWNLSGSERPRVGGREAPSPLLVVNARPESRGVFGDSVAAAVRQYFARFVSGADALREALEHGAWDAVIVDLRFDPVDPKPLLRLVRHYWPSTPVVLWGQAASATDSCEEAFVECFGDESADALLAHLPSLGAAAGRARVDRVAHAIGPAERSAYLQELADHVPECLWLQDLGCHELVYINAAYTGITGYPVPGDTSDWRALFHCVIADDVARFAETMARSPFGGLNEELRIRRADGEIRWVHVRTFGIRDRDGVVTRVGGLIRDVSAVVAQKVQLYQVTHFDGLTTLPNRMAMHERLAASVSMARRNGWLLGLLLIDLDRFKVINDTLGHAIGDELLRQAAMRLSSCLRDSDTVGRMGGDEFAVILADMDSPEMASVVARKVVEVLAEPFVIGGQELFVSASVGISLYPDDADDIDVLIRNADAAMYRAKDAGRNDYAFYTAEINARARRRLGMETDLRQALVRGEFELHYQPKVDCRTGQVSGFEALIRWRHPSRGLVGPNEFVPLLEETGLVVPVGDWVMRTACAQLKIWHDAGFDALDMAVNVSARQMEGRRLLESVMSALDATKIPATALQLELTESLLMRDPPVVADLLAELKAMGVQVAVDDFGTGYSSLSYLKRFPLDNLKVDRAFVQDIAASAGDASITRAVIHMGHELALKVVAEGVETEAQLEALQAAGCDEVQGYLFSRPVPAEEILPLLAGGRSLPVASSRLGEFGALAIPDPAMARELAHLKEERDRLAEAAQRARALWRQTLDQVGDPVLAIDDDLQIVFANQEAELQLASAGILPGVSIADCLPAITASGRIAESTESIAIGERWYRLRSSPIETENLLGATMLWFTRVDAGAQNG